LASLSLVAAFLPVLLMAGIITELFREFAMTLSIAIVISLVVSVVMEVAPEFWRDPEILHNELDPENETGG